MKENIQTNSVDTSKSKSIKIEIPKLELPSGGGGVRGIDSEYQMNKSNGAVNFTIQLPISKGRGNSPSVSLHYDSTAGNGLFGIGWSLDIGSIKRSTKNSLPQYQDNLESDTFIISGSEELVPALKIGLDGKYQKIDGKYVKDISTSPDTLYSIQRYIPKIEGNFAKLERWVEKSSNKSFWKVTNGDNTVTVYGKNDSTKIINPNFKNDPSLTNQEYEWLAEFSFDDKGNCVHYIYKNEDDLNLNLNEVHNKFRVQETKLTYTNKYISKILYGNKVPYLKFNDPYLNNSNYLFETVFDYGEYNDAFEEVNSWNFREDPFSFYNSGFEIRTTRRLSRVFTVHKFQELVGGSAVVKSLEFQYDLSSKYSLLKSVESIGYIKKTDGSYSKSSLPKTEFEYYKHSWNEEVTEININSQINLPVGITNNYRFVDLYSEGLPGILYENEGGWYYSANLGKGDFANPVLLENFPNNSKYGDKLHLLELESDGKKQLLNLQGNTGEYFELTSESVWEIQKSIHNNPNFDFSTTNNRLFDLTGDGKPDIVDISADSLKYYKSLGKEGFNEVQNVHSENSEDFISNLTENFENKNVFLADMNGDGLTDIVKVEHSSISYWPNMGYGKFGDVVVMDNFESFGSNDNFNLNCIKFADLDGTGISDILYFGNSKIEIYRNLSGNKFDDPIVFDSSFEFNENIQIDIVDILGNGMSSIVWSSNLDKHSFVSFKYIDIFNSIKPNLLKTYKNNFGKEVTYNYLPSSSYYLQDRENNQDWITKLHFIVHCLSKIESHDHITGCKYSNIFSYHHGYYDSTQREFRGFGRIDVLDNDIYTNFENIADQIEKKEIQSPVLSKTWYHLGLDLKKNDYIEKLKSEFWQSEFVKLGGIITVIEKENIGFELTIGTSLQDLTKSSLDPETWDLGFRACKSLPIRNELFAVDTSEISTPENKILNASPYRVSTVNYNMELLQPASDNDAVFIVKESENIEYIYDRVVSDPKIVQKINLKLDDFGNPLEGVVVVYPRQIVDTSLPIKLQTIQSKAQISFIKNEFTNDINTQDVFKIRLPCSTTTYELKGVVKSESYYKLSDFENVYSSSNVVDYSEFNTSPSGSDTQLRIVEQGRKLYYNDDLLSPLPYGQLGKYAIIYEDYLLAYTPELILDIYGTKLANSDLIKSGFVNFSDLNWWIPSGVTKYRNSAESMSIVQNRFMMPLEFTDALNSKTKIEYYSNYFLFIEKITDELGNEDLVEKFNFRTLTPQRIRDENDNISEVLTDELGAIKAFAVFGKGSEGDNLIGLAENSDVETADIQLLFNSTPSNIISNSKNLLKNASVRIVRGLDNYAVSGIPVVTYTIQRENYAVFSPNSQVQIKVEYLDGSGEVILSKIQAEPGLAKSISVNPDDTYTITEVDTSPNLRWVGTGRVIKNNKGNIIKQFEPYFSVTHNYESEKELVENGVTPINHYDPLARIIQTDFPNGTFKKVIFLPYKSIEFDPNDNILASEWYNNRANHLIDSELVSLGKNPILEFEAAESSKLHDNTPKVIHFDSLGRVIMQSDDNGVEKSENFFEIDFEGNVRKLVNARGNDLIEYKYDMQGNICFQNSTDAGKRWIFSNIFDLAINNWDERNHKLEFGYDKLHRLVTKKVIGGDSGNSLDNVYYKVIYGEEIINPKTTNSRGQISKIYDTAGLIDISTYDFNYRSISQSRRFLKDYKSVPNYNIPNLDSLLETEILENLVQFDALGRIVTQTSSDNTIMRLKYTESRLMGEVKIEQSGIEKIFVKNIDYNEKGQRLKITYGNDVTTSYIYDPFTFRIINQKSQRQNLEIIQNLKYTYDPVGNNTSIQDLAIPVTFFNGVRVDNISRFVYDPLYRLINATGREHIAQTSFGDIDNIEDFGFIKQYDVGDGIAFRNYTQIFKYDLCGNILELKHLATDNDYTRNYNYSANNNRLQSTVVTNSFTPAMTYNYTYHPSHGYLDSIPNLTSINWNFLEKVTSISTQKVNSGTPETTYYQYDGEGRRVRKITENFAEERALPTKKNERIYIGVVEIYREFETGSMNLQRNSYFVNDSLGRIAMIEKRVFGNDNSELNLVRYQISNFQESVNIEVDDSTSANVISYEEFHPFGTTSYLCINKSIKSSSKRYRYTGRERDEETGFEMHNARYYIPWLGRWLSTDPIGVKDSLNMYEYSKNNPIRLSDPSGYGAWDRFCGGLKMVGGALETVAGGGLFLAGVASSEIGVGIPVAIAGGAVTLHGVDTTVSGFRTMWNGEQVDTVTSSVILQDGLGMSRTSANLTDAGISVVGTLGANLATRAPALATAVTADGASVVPAVETSVTIAFKPAGAVGHNMVGVTTEAGTTWSHLVIAESGTVTGSSGISVMTSGRAAVIMSESGPLASSGYRIVTIPVSSSSAAAADAYVVSTVARDAPIILAIEGGTATTSSLTSYTLLGNSCSTYAAEVLGQAGVYTPPVTAPIVNFVSGALQSSRVMQPLTTAGVVVTSSYGVTQGAPLLISTAEAAPPPVIMMTVAPRAVSVAPTSPPPMMTMDVSTESCTSTPVPEPDYSTMVCEEPDYSQMVCQ